MSESSLLLDLGVPFGRTATGLLVEAQALNGLRLWAKHFDRVTVCAPELFSSLKVAAIPRLYGPTRPNCLKEGVMFSSHFLGDTIREITSAFALK